MHEWVLSPRRGPGRWIARAVLVLVGALAGASACYIMLTRHPDPELGAAAQDRAQLQQQLDQSRQTLRVAESRGAELERQIAAQLQKLRECEDNLAFFRKARDARH